MPIVLTVLGFLWWWPLGLLMLAFWMARGRFGCRHYAVYAWDGPTADRKQADERWERKMARMQDKVERFRAKVAGVRSRSDWFGSGSSGNRAFDDYRAETIRRLEDEQREFKDFLARLRFARDRAEFDQFMAEQRQRPAGPDSRAEAPPAEPRD